MKSSPIGIDHRAVTPPTQLKVLRVLCLVIAQVAAAPAIAQTSAHPAAVDATRANPTARHGATPIRVRLSAHKVETRDGKEILADATRARPGDVIEYRAVYSNHGAEVVQGVLGTLPVPSGTVYVPESARPVNVLVRTANHADYAPLPLVVQVVGNDGVTRSAPVPVADYRSLRWELGNLAPGADKTVVARVIIPAPASAQAAVPLQPGPAIQ